MQTEISGNFLFHTFFCFTYFVFCVFVSLTAVRISRSVYFFTRNVSFQSLYSGQFTSSTQLINLQFQVIVASWKFDLLKTSVYKPDKPLKLHWWLLLRLARVKSQIREAPRGNPRSWDLANFYSNQTTGHLHNLHETFVASPRPVNQS